MGVIIDRFSPTNLFIRLDLPTLGLPTILTKPDLWGVDMRFKNKKPLTQTESGVLVAGTGLEPVTFGL